MNNLIICINAVLPILISILIGYAARLLKIVNDDFVEKANRIAFTIFCPLMVFNNIYTSSYKDLHLTGQLLYAGLGVIGAFLLSIPFTKFLIKNRENHSVVIQAVFRSNFVVIGLSMATQLVPGGNTAIVTIMLAVVIPIFNALSVLALELFSGAKADLKSLLRKILLNPLIIACFAGIAVKLIDCSFPQSIETVISNFGHAASPLMLFLLGAFFRIRNLRDGIRDILIASFGRLVLIPGIFLTGAYLLGFRGMEFAAMIGVFASSSAATSFTMAQQMGGNADLAGNIIVVTSILCPLTVFSWSMLFMHLGAF